MTGPMVVGVIGLTLSLVFAKLRIYVLAREAREMRKDISTLYLAVARLQDGRVLQRQSKADP